ncbi:MAG: hypothetical protein APF80_09515 [Alphaproteobacteria bacterium BRH_c36]|nr:MAG: hypothetical protein APF80_09515 [Alphaproteobacteria bacterium BRH_c36]
MKSENAPGSYQLEPATAVVNESFIAAPRGLMRLKTGSYLALAFGTVCAISTTLIPTDYDDVPQLIDARDCGRLCALASHPAASPDPGSNTVEAPPITVFDVAGGKVDEANSAPAANAASKAPPEDLRSVHVPLKDAVAASEPITSRPVADRLDFAGAANYNMLAGHNGLQSGRLFTSLPASVLAPLPPAHETAALTAGRELKALPPEAKLAAFLDQPVLQSTKTPQVAGWHLIRAIETEEMPEEASLASHVLPKLPMRKPDVPPSYLTAAPPKIPQSKISRRVRHRPAAPAASTASDGSWKNRALFRDNN